MESYHLDLMRAAMTIQVATFEHADGTIPSVASFQALKRAITMAEKAAFKLARAKTFNKAKGD